jgi:hypothetical protein
MFGSQLCAAAVIRPPVRLHGAPYTSRPEVRITVVRKCSFFIPLTCTVAPLVERIGTQRANIQLHYYILQKAASVLRGGSRTTGLSPPTWVCFIVNEWTGEYFTLVCPLRPANCQTGIILVEDLVFFSM